MSTRNARVDNTFNIICNFVIGLCCLSLITLIAGVVISFVFQNVNRELSSNGAFEDYAPQRCVVHGAQLLRSLETRPIIRCGSDRSTRQCRSTSPYVRWVYDVRVDDGRNESTLLPACFDFCLRIPADNEPNRMAATGDVVPCLVHRRSRPYSLSEMEAIKAGDLVVTRVVLLSTTEADFVTRETHAALEISFGVLLAVAGAAYIVGLALWLSDLCRNGNGKHKQAVDTSEVVANINDTAQVPPGWQKVERESN
jgi:hypothetical protein